MQLPQGCGVLLLFGGIGVVAALIVSPDRQMQQMWSLGLIPLMLGAGCIVYYVLLRPAKP